MKKLILCMFVTVATPCFAFESSIYRGTNDFGECWVGLDISPDTQTVRNTRFYGYYFSLDGKKFVNGFNASPRKPAFGRHNEEAVLTEDTRYGSWSGEFKSSAAVPDVHPNLYPRNEPTYAMGMIIKINSKISISPNLQQPQVIDFEDRHYIQTRTAYTKRETGDCADLVLLTGDEARAAIKRLEQK